MGSRNRPRYRLRLAFIKLFILFKMRGFQINPDHSYLHLASIPAMNMAKKDRTGALRSRAVFTLTYATMGFILDM
jgi:hypothetical protein